MKINEGQIDYTEDLILFNLYRIDGITVNVGAKSTLLLNVIDQLQELHVEIPILLFYTSIMGHTQYSIWGEKKFADALNPRMWTFFTRAEQQYTN